MGLRYRRSINLGHGVRVNVGTRGASLSFGGKGLRTSIHSSGRVTSTVGIPGTGLYYTTSSGGRRRSGGSSRRSSGSRQRTNYATIQRQLQAQQEKQAQLEQNKKLVAEFNELVEDIKSIHKTCDEYIDWNHIVQVPAPFDRAQRGPKESIEYGKLGAWKPRFYEKWFPSLGERRRQALVNQVEKARQEDASQYAEWQNLNDLARKIIQGDIDSYLLVINEMQPFDDILNYGSNFEVGTDSPDKMEVEFRVKSAEVVPSQVLSLTKTGKLSTKAMTKTMYYDLVQDYICSCAIRVARDMFALLPVNRVVIHAVDNVLNTATGYEEEVTVLSVALDRNRFQSVNFEMIDPSDMCESFPCNMNFKKTQGMKPVQRIQ